MKIAIIADIHDNLANLKKCLRYCAEQNTEVLFCLGDVTNKETLSFIAEKFIGKIYLVRGNMEIYNEDDALGYKNIKYFGRVGRVALGNKNIGLCHEPFLRASALKLGACDYIFYGHTHRPWIEDIAGYKLINPGTLGGVFERATFALWDTDKAEPELVVLDMIDNHKTSDNAIKQ